MNNFNFQKYAKSDTQCILPCPDQYFADLIDGQLITRTREDIDYHGNKTANGINGSNLNCVIVIVLESPHKEEFGITGLPKGPAMGKTGSFFIRNTKGFVDFISNSGVSYILKGNYQLVYVNSVQYKTSLRISLNTQSARTGRDNIWLSVFNNDGGEIDLKQRLKALRPQLVINLCTKGVKNLQLYVDKAISVPYKYTFGTHPSTWNFCYAYIK